MENPTSEETNILRSRRSVSEIVSAPYLISGVDRFGRSVKALCKLFQTQDALMKFCYGDKNLCISPCLQMSCPLDNSGSEHLCT
ncbi:hypothetical protein CEXT_79501 [Caerostris extrusa]|uniref:Uncharacterized protein n=1 Tax=Caerostris extrusa TaxID=172846 RepID=A0AAV4UQR9_CAEEX|nr:hypothetical protein CEXT_79501 [Caerostris extrusa]